MLLAFSKFSMYAEDTTLSFESDVLCNSSITFNKEMNTISQCMYCDHLTKTVLKTRSMIFHKSKVNPPYSYPLRLGRSAIRRVLEIKTLDVYLDPCLRFHLHIREVV